MSYDLEEQEKLDLLKAWWARYSMLIVTLVAVVLLASGSWWGWQAYQAYEAKQAMGYFEALDDAARLGGPDSAVRIKAAAATLRSKYPESGYAARAALVAAQALQQQEDMQGAREQLSWLAQQSHHVSLQPVARLHLAALLLDQHEYDEALAQLEDAPAAFAALFADRRGDIFQAKNQHEQARMAWQNAINNLPTDHTLTQIIQLKLDALAGT